MEKEQNLHFKLYTISEKHFYYVKELLNTVAGGISHLEYRISSVNDETKKYCRSDTMHYCMYCWLHYQAHISFPITYTPISLHKLLLKLWNCLRIFELCCCLFHISVNS